MAALESLLTLLSWLLARFPRAHHRSQIAYTLPFHSTYLVSVPLCLPPTSLWLVVRSSDGTRTARLFHALLRKVRDSNPRIVSTIAALALRCFQPLSQPSLFRLLRENLILTSFILARCPIHPLYNHLQFLAVPTIHTVQCLLASFASLRHPTTALHTRCSISPLANIL